MITLIKINRYLLLKLPVKWYDIFRLENLTEFILGNLDKKIDDLVIRSNVVFDSSATKEFNPDILELYLLEGVTLDDSRISYYNYLVNMHYEYLKLKAYANELDRRNNTNIRYTE